MKKGPYTVTDSKIVYKNPWITVAEDQVIKPDGSKGIFGTVDYGTSVTIVALDKNNTIYLVKEYCYVLEHYEVEAPSGGIDKKEFSLTAAKRELLEETGLTSPRWIELGHMNPFTVIIKCPTYLYLAFEVEKKGHVEEGIELVTMPFEKAYKLVLESKITHAASCIAILKTHVYLTKQK